MLKDVGAVIYYLLFKDISDWIKGFTLEKVKQELLGGWTLFEKFYIPTLVLLQLVVFMIYPENPLSMIAGVAGVLCVTFVAKGKMSNYFFGFIQTGIMLVLGAQAFLIGETGENVFYFVTQFLGIKEWKKNMKKEEIGENSNSEAEVVQTRKLSLKQWVLLVLAVSISTGVLGFIFSTFNGTQPYIDAGTLILALFGQMLMVYRYREQWCLWLVLNCMSSYQWLTLGNMSLFVLYIAFIINTVYGYSTWSKNIGAGKSKDTAIDKV